MLFAAEAWRLNKNIFCFVRQQRYLWPQSSVTFCNRSVLSPHISNIQWRDELWPNLLCIYATTCTKQTCKNGCHANILGNFETGVAIQSWQSTYTKIKEIFEQHLLHQLDLFDVNNTVLNRTDGRSCVDKIPCYWSHVNENRSSSFLCKQCAAQKSH